MRIVVLAGLVLLLTVSAANAENAPDLRLDSTASEVGGHAVSVWCEADDINWMQLVRNAFQDETMDASRVRGFNVRDSTVVYLSPSVCLTLRSGLKDAPPNGEFLDRGTALFVFLFEALRQSVPDMGVSREAELSCRSVMLVPHYATTLLGIPTRITVTKTVSRRVRVKGRWVTRRVRVRRLGANPLLAQIAREAEAARRAEPAPYYVGNRC